jgi:glycosyltransferase involved in cell wall biosynthesis
MSEKLFIVYHDLGLGGIQRKIVEIVKYLQQKENIEILCVLKKKKKFNLKNEINFNNVKIVYYENWLRKKPPFVFFLIYSVWKFKPDYILAFSSPFAINSIIAKLLFPFKKITTVVSLEPTTKPSLQFPVYYKYHRPIMFLAKFVYPLADKVFTVNSVFAKDIVNKFNIPENKVRVTNNWSRFNNYDLKTTVKKFDLVFVGRLAPEKNLRFLFKVVKKLKIIEPDISLCVVGSGKDSNKLKKWIVDNNMKKSIFLVGNQAAVANFLMQSKIFVLPSKTEGQPIALLEAMSLGLPSVVSNYKGVRDVVKDGENGFIFKNSKELMDLTLRLLNNKRLRKRIGNKARKYALNVHTVDNVEDYLRAFKL